MRGRIIAYHCIGMLKIYLHPFPKATQIVLGGLLLLGSFPQRVQGQTNLNARIETLEEVKKETDEMFELINAANAQIQTNSNEAIRKLEESLRKAYALKNERGEAFTYQSLGAVYVKISRFEEAISYYQKAQKLFKRLQEDKAYYLVTQQLAKALESAGRVKEAAKEYERYMSLALDKGNSVDVNKTKEDLARVYFNAGKYEESAGLYRQLVAINEGRADTARMVSLYKYLGKAYAGQKDTVLAMKYLQKAASLSDHTVKSAERADNYQEVSRGYNEVGDYKNSIEYEKKAYSLNKKSGRRDAKLLSNTMNLGNDYLLMDRATEAIPFLEESIDLAKDLGQIKESGEAYKALSTAYAQKGEMEKARLNFEAYVRMKESVLEKREQEIESRSTMGAGFADKEKQIALLVEGKELDEKRIALLEESKNLEAKKLANQRQVNYILSAVAVLLLVGLVFLVRSTRQKQVANKLMAIRSLQSQMNPHFIFNSLNSVNSFISENDERSANKYLSEFARLMRQVLNHSKKDFVSLEDELDVLSRYLKLEHLRFRDKFDYSFVIDEQIEADQLLIPPMLVQPFIENSVWHGLRYKEGKGNLKVEFSQSEKELIVLIEDDGIGIEASKRLKTKNQRLGKSTGIRSTQERLKLLNEVHETRIDSEIGPILADGTGTRVRLKMRKMYTNKEVAEKV
jgi:two-component system LytT family sensor kinase